MSAPSPARRRFRTVVLGLILAGVGLFAITLTRIEQTAQATHLEVMQPKLAAIGHPVPAIVLGMGPGVEKPILDRAELAAELWRLGYVSFFITSGGQGSDEPEPESRTLRNALVSRGVPAGAIREESASTSTRENLAFSKRLLLQSGPLPAPILIVTHDFHAFRTAALARAQGYEAIVVSARCTRVKIPVINIVREVAAYWRAWLGRAV